MRLSAYFSRADENYTSDGIKNLSVGNTEVVANIIHDLTGADLFKIEPVKSYPKDYHETTHLAQIELNNNARPAIKNKLTNTEEYDIIYLGYPNWWGTMSMVVLTFLESINLTGKIIKPFCTHEGSGMSNSESGLKRHFLNAIIKKGLPIRGSDADASDEKIKNWIGED